MLVFLSLYSIRPRFQSTLKNIHLVAVRRTVDIYRYGMNTFLSPFVEDLKRLYCDGINVFFGGEHHVLRGALLAFLADTLAAHSLGGFKGSMSFSLCVYRTCMMTSEQLTGSFSEASCSLQMPDSYFEQCSFLNFWSPEGTLFNYIWNQLFFYIGGSSWVLRYNWTST